MRITPQPVREPGPDFPQVTELPAGFVHRTLLVADVGITRSQPSKHDWGFRV